ncbi:MAG TPA: formylglycine-generating enzyme family protein [Desulfuromonadales bacterium]|nr:formylglycine-generating enzyme family protein [Desulfuromonadales bacterium]
MGTSFIGLPIEVMLDLQLTLEESLQEQESYQEEVVVKEAGWFSKAITEMQPRTRTVTKKQNVIKTISTCFEFCPVPAGTFLMGSEKDGPVHQVTISHDFYIAKYPVTQTQWKAVMGSSPCKFNGADRPVEQVSWDDCQEFIKRLNATGKGIFRLPTEAEWEYACRAGSTGVFCFGDLENQLCDYAWYNANSDNQTQPVGKKKPNAWGIHDMHGNVWEWCQDWYDDYSAESVTDPQGPPFSNMPVRVFRGGCWRGVAGFAASAHRGGRGVSYRDGILGVRLAYQKITYT